MSQDTWSAVDRYVTDLLLGGDADIEQSLERSAAAGLPPIAVSAPQGRLLWMLARLARARRILEIGTLGGYSAIWLARALPPGGTLVTLELSEHHATVARDNLARAGVGDRAQVLTGPAAESLAALQRESVEPFDLVFIDADKTGYPDYWRASLALSRPGTLIVADNVVREGQVTDASSSDEAVRAVRETLALAAAESRVRATVLQTVGAKGYDGLCLALVE